MKRMINPLLIAFAQVAILIGGAQGQGTVAFQNLDFEQASIPNVPAGQSGADVETIVGTPGWTVYAHSDGLAETTILHNNLSLGSAAVAILGPSWSSSAILQGSYTLLLQASWPGMTIKPAIAQTGTIPETARSIQYSSKILHGMPGVSFAGQTLSVSILGGSQESGYTLSADVSAFAGQTGELRFFGDGYLDDIRFTSVPEPSTVGLLVLGAALFASRVRKGGFV